MPKAASEGRLAGTEPGSVDADAVVSDLPPDRHSTGQEPTVAEPDLTVMSTPLNTSDTSPKFEAWVITSSPG